VTIWAVRAEASQSRGSPESCQTSGGVGIGKVHRIPPVRLGRLTEKVKEGLSPHFGGVGKERALDAESLNRRHTKFYVRCYPWKRGAGRTMATVAIGDIHGNRLALEDLLEKVLPTLKPQDVLVFLGDTIDRGPDSRGCVERISRLKRENPHSVVTLLGNHEDWMLRSLRDPTRHSWILGMEAFETIASYAPDAAVSLRRELERAGIRLITERVRIPYEIFFDLLPPDHMAFFQNLKPFHRAEGVVCVHAGVEPEGRPLHSQDLEVLIWGPEGFPDGYIGREAIVYGHWDNATEDENGWPQPCIKENHTFGIDTISKGVLTAIRLPDGKIFQSKRFKEGEVSDG